MTPPKSTRDEPPDVIIDGLKFPPFDLARLFRTVFVPGKGEKVAVLTDLPDPSAVRGLAFLQHEGRDVQRRAYHTLYEGLLARREELGLASVDFYAYRETGGSNLDLPEDTFTPAGERVPLREVYATHTIVMFSGRYSATAPATALAKEFRIRGATMHGLNDVILASGLAVDYEQVSARAERLRLACTRADRVRMEWRVECARGGPREIALTVELGRQEAQKSHGLVRELGDVANLPAGEVYFVPTGAEGRMPRTLEAEDGREETIAIVEVRGGRIVALDEVARGDPAAAKALLDTIAEDPNVGAITELGLGTQTLPFAGTDIQDEKILGTAHLATGRSDHLGGGIGPKDFKQARHASHNDILWTPTRPAGVALTRVSMEKDGAWTTLIEGYRAMPFLERLL
jgi:aminopeptidase